MKKCIISNGNSMHILKIEGPEQEKKASEKVLMLLFWCFTLIYLFRHVKTANIDEIASCYSII